MKPKIKSRYSSKNIHLIPPFIITSKYQIEEKDLKPAEEWIYGSLKNFNKKVNNSNINFKNQKAFNGYKKNRIDLYKSLVFNIIFIILVQIDNLSKRFELSQISNIFYQKLSNIYKKGDFPNHLRHSSKIIRKFNKSSNKNKFISTSLPNINKFKQGGK